VYIFNDCQDRLTHKLLLTILLIAQLPEEPGKQNLNSNHSRNMKTEAKDEMKIHTD
jgi:hypothetical protein